MKSEAKVRRKLKQVIFRHLKKRLQTTLRKRPENCLYNRQPSTHPKLKPITGLPRVCIHVEQAGAVCDTSHPNSADYKGCPYFKPSKSESEVRKEFIELAKSPRDRVAEHMPDAAALMWVLEQEEGVPQGDAESAANGDEGEGEDEDEEPAPVGVTAHRAKAPVFEETVAALIDIKGKRFDMVEDQWLTPTRWWMFWRSKVWRSRWNPIQWPWYWRHRNNYSGEPVEPPVCNPAVDE